MDRGPNVVKAIENRNERLDCYDHILSNVLQSSFDSEDLSANLSHLLVKNVVTHFKRKQILRQLKKTLKQSMPVRWNSNYIMLKPILQQVEDVNSLIAGDNLSNATIDNEEDTDDTDKRNDEGEPPILVHQLRKWMQFFCEKLLSS